MFQVGWISVEREILIRPHLGKQMGTQRGLDMINDRGSPVFICQYDI
jgi:hypothetical protein